MYWISLKYPCSVGEVRLTPHLGTRKDSELFFELLCKLCHEAEFSCKIKLFKNTEVIRKCSIAF